MTELKSMRQIRDLDEQPQPIWSRGWNGNAKAKAIPTAAKFWDLACDYFEWCDANPFMRQELLKGGPSAGARVDMPVTRPYSWAGFESYLDARGVITKLDDYKRNYQNRYTKFVDVVRRVDRVILQQKYEGVVTGFFNPTILAPELAAAAARAEAVQDEELSSRPTGIKIIRPANATIRLERPGQTEDAEIVS